MYPPKKDIKDILNITSVLSTSQAIVIPTSEMLIILGLMTLELLTLPAF